MNTPTSSTSWLPPVRPEYVRSPELPGDVVVEAPLPVARLLIAQSWLRKTLIALVLLAAWEIAARPLHYMASRYAEWTSEANGGADPGQAALPSVDEIIRKQSMDFFGEAALIGTPEDVAAQIDDYRSNCRLTHLVCALPLPGMPAQQILSGMELFAREVIPRFRGS